MKNAKRTLLTCTFFVLLAVFTVAFGQEATSEAVTEESLWTKFQKGGWAMWPLTGLSIAGVGLIVYNIIMVRTKVLAPPAAIAQVKQLAAAVDIEGINRVCNANVNPVTNIVSAGLERLNAYDYDEAQINKAMEEASAEEFAGPFAMINYLNVIAGVAPMVGMLGTVSGMVKAFSSIGAAGGLADPAEMADNISEALITTMSGLSIAIPVLLAYFVFKNVYGKIVTSLTRNIGDILFSLSSAIKYGAEGGEGYEEGYEEGYAEE